MPLVLAHWASAGAEAALVRPQFMSGTHTLTVALFGLLRTGDTLLAATGRLSNKRATTHWMLADGLQARYPDIEVDSEQNLIQQGSLIYSGGSLAGVDARQPGRSRGDAGDQRRAAR